MTGGMISAELLSRLYPEVPAGEPVATVYLDSSHNTPAAPGEIELRWRTARDSLAAAGARGPTLEALAAAVGQHQEPPGPQGQVLVAAGGEVRLDSVLPRPPRRETARWAPLPHLMPLVAQVSPIVPYVLVVIDRLGADIRVHGAHGAWTEEVQGRGWPVHKTGIGGWSELRYQHKVEETGRQNAKQVAEVVASGVRRGGARLVLVAGEVQARSELTRALDGPSRGLLATVEAGGRADGTDEQALRAEVDRLVARVSAADDEAVLATYREESGQHDRAVTGAADTVAALRRGQVETLVLVDDPSATSTAWVGPEPVHLGLARADLDAFGVADPAQDRLDAALVRAAAGTGAAILTTAPGQLDLTDGLGAVLRYA
jgi:Bacterial archaeo-eukaryotic release factor family 2